MRGREIACLAVALGPLAYQPGRERERESLCERERERKKDRKCVCERERERERQTYRHTAILKERE